MQCRWRRKKRRLTGGQPPNTRGYSPFARPASTPICADCAPEIVLRSCIRLLKRSVLVLLRRSGDAPYTCGSARGLLCSIQRIFPPARHRTLAPPQRTGRNTPYGIVWLNRFHRRMDTKMDTKGKVGRADSQAGFGVLFGVHFSTKRGRFGGFQRLWRLQPSRVSGWESAK
jgi:hypothetical protein